MRRLGAAAEETVQVLTMLPDLCLPVRCTCEGLCISVFIHSFGSRCTITRAMVVQHRCAHSSTTLPSRRFFFSCAILPLI